MVGNQVVILCPSRFDPHPPLRSTICSRFGRYYLRINYTPSSVLSLLLKPFLFFAWTDPCPSPIQSTVLRLYRALCLGPKREQIVLRRGGEDQIARGRVSRPGFQPPSTSIYSVHVCNVIHHLASTYHLPSTLPT